MSGRLTAQPGTLEFLKQLLEIALGSDHPMDKALAKVLSKRIGEKERFGLAKASEIEEAALYVIAAWDNELFSLPNAIGRLACVLEVAGFQVERTVVTSPRLAKLNRTHRYFTKGFWEEVRRNQREGEADNGS